MSEAPNARGGAPAGPETSAAAAGDGQGSAQRSSTSSAAGWLGTIKGAGPIVAWIAAVACGLKAAGIVGVDPVPGQSPDLLSAVLHGAGAWVGVLVIWIAGVSACERLVLAARPASPDRERTLKPPMNADERR